MDLMRVQTRAVLLKLIQYCNAVLGEAPQRRETIGDLLKHLKRKENAPIVSFELQSAQKSSIPDETIKRNNINMLSPRFCIAPMDLSESSSFSIG
jgi:hypothetical protein